MALQGQRLKYSVNVLLTCILYCEAAGDVGPGYLIRTVCKHSALHEYYLRPAFLQRLPWLYLGKAIRFSRDVLMFFASI